MSKQFWAIIAVIVLVFVGIVVVTGNKDSKNNANSSQPTSHVMGNGKANIKLVEYGDYQCPICGLYYSPLKQAVQSHQDQITFQFRNFPITSIHPNAFAGSRAAEAAGDQGKYWEMHDLLYENQSGWSQSQNPMTFFERYATSLGLNVATFKTDYASSKTNNAINADLHAADKLGVNATPTFFLDGKKIELSKLVDNTNQPTVEKISAVLDAAIAAKQKQ